MTDTFLKTLTSVVTGVRQLDEIARVLVTSAVEDALLCVARDFGHEYSSLLSKYRDQVVRRHASGSLSEKTQCGGLTKGGKKCGKRAVLQGYCQQHAAQMAEEDAKRRKVEAYKAALPPPDTTQQALLELMDVRCRGSGSYLL